MNSSSRDRPGPAGLARLAAGLSVTPAARFVWNLGRGAWMLGRRHGPEPTPLRKPPDPPHRGGR